jgi:hypothetical protein
MNEIHPYNDYKIPKYTRLLIIGTAPPSRFSRPRPENWRPLEGDVDFYYGSKDNLLWSEIFPELYPDCFLVGETTSADKRRSFLRCQNFWMHDICEEYTRKGTGALDKDLDDVRRRTDLRRILEEHETIDSLIFTGRSAEKHSGKQMECQKLIRPYQFGADGISKKSMPRLRSLSIAVKEGERKIRTATVPSPSPSTLRVYSLKEIIHQYRTALFQNPKIAS